ncbi:ABC transporter permease [Catenulispora subtropica]|uniref:ABC transporter permease n=1 Tax=Catenulispora subtropica TaxID=450798 RepID=A0ABP5CHX6_9ACTN
MAALAAFGEQPSGAGGLRAAARALAGDSWPGFVARRLARLLVSLAVVVTASFAMIHLIPGDPVHAALGPTADPALVAARRHQLGLDRPLPAQYGSFLNNLFHGRLGESIISQTPVSQIVSDRLPATLRLVAPAVVLILLVAVPAGMIAAVLTRDGRRRRGELAFAATTGVLAALPEFLLAVGLIALFAVTWPVFPVAGQSDLSSYVLPVLSLTVVPTASLSRVVRVEALRVLREDYMRTARAKRLPARLVYLRHALPNLLTSSLTIGGMLFTSLLAGTVLVENVFAWPGLGSTIVQAITTKDYPLVQGVVLVYGTFALLITFAVDMAVAAVDPRSTVRGN